MLIFSSQLDSITESWWNLSQSDSVFLGQTDSFFQNESKWLDVYGSNLGQHDSIFESIYSEKILSAESSLTAHRYANNTKGLDYCKCIDKKYSIYIPQIPFYYRVS